MCNGAICFGGKMELWCFGHEQYHPREAFDPCKNRRGYRLSCREYKKAKKQVLEKSYRDSGLYKIWDEKHRKKNPKSNKEKHWKRKGINITYEQFKTMVDEQQGKCAICGKDVGDSLHVDQ